MTGSVTYNGKGFDQFKAAHTAAYVDQNDLHQPELTVRETFDFAARCQGVGHKADELEELLKREKELGITPDPDMDAFMKAEIRTGKRESIVTDLIIKMLGLDVSATAAAAAAPAAAAAAAAAAAISSSKANATGYQSRMT